MDVEGSEGNFFRAIVNIRRHDFPTARVCIDRARHLLDAELQARVLVDWPQIFSPDFFWKKSLTNPDTASVLPFIMCLVGFLI
jgi:hypothetical protein